MNIVIRNIKYEDIEKVVDIKIDGWQTAYRGIVDDDFLDNMDRNANIEKRKKDWKENGFIVAESENEILGFCRYSEGNDDLENFPNIDCEIRALYVKSNKKRLGIGKKLFEYAVNEFKSKGKKQMIIWCLKDNFPSRAFYEKMGGELAGIQTSEFGGKEYYLVGYRYNLDEIEISEN